VNVLFFLTEVHSFFLFAFGANYGVLATTCRHFISFSQELHTLIFSFGANYGVLATKYRHFISFSQK